MASPSDQHYSATPGVGGRSARRLAAEWLLPLIALLIVAGLAISLVAGLGA